MWPWGACWLRTPGERQAGPPRRSDGSGLGVAFACAVGRSETLLESFKGFKRFRGFRGFKRLGAGKRQASTPIMWPWGACWLRTAGERQAGPPRRSDGSGLGVAFACAVGRSETFLESFKGFKRFRGFRGFKGLGAGKRTACWTAQKKRWIWPWTPIRSH